jgi:heptosyltransferase I
MKILIVKPSSLGDIVQGLMVAQSLRDQMPQARLSWIAQDRFAPIVQGCPTIERTYLFRRYDRRNGMKDLLREVRQDEFDVGLDFHGMGRSVTMLMTSRSKRKIGLSTSRSLLRPFYPEKSPLPPGGRDAHAVDILLQFLPMLGLKAELRGDVPLKTSPLESFVPQLGAKDYVLITPNSRGVGREWHGFLELAGRLLQEHPALNIVWDSPTKWEIPGAIQNSGRFLRTENTNLEQLLGLIENARLVISNDSGPMHMAAALGTPLLATFGPTKPEHTGPYPLTRASHHIVRAPEGDLSRLDVETVLSRVNQALEVGRAD